MENDNTLVTIKTFTYASEAGLVQSFLESEGIPTFLKDEFMAGIYGGISAFGGIKLQVMESDAEKALQLLEKGGFK